MYFDVARIGFFPLIFPRHYCDFFFFFLLKSEIFTHTCISAEQECAQVRASRSVAREVCSFYFCAVQYSVT